MSSLHCPPLDKGSQALAGGDTGICVSLPRGRLTKAWVTLMGAGGKDEVCPSCRSQPCKRNYTCKEARETVTAIPARSRRNFSH